MVHPYNEWMDDANCIDVDVNLFFPARDKDTYKVIADQGKSYCFGGAKDFEGKTLPACPVRKDCLWYAVLTEKEHGIMGGMSHRERNAMVRKWQKQYSNEMTLKEYIFQLNAKGKK